MIISELFVVPPRAKESGRVSNLNEATRIPATGPSGSLPSPVYARFVSHAHETLKPVEERSPPFVILLFTIGGYFYVQR